MIAGNSGRGSGMGSGLGSSLGAGLGDDAAAATQILNDLQQQISDTNIALAMSFQKNLDQIADTANKMGDNTSKGLKPAKQSIDEFDAQMGEASKRVGASFDRALTGMILGTVSLRNGARQVAQSLAQSFASASEQIATRWIGDRLRELIAHQTTEQAETAATTAGAAARTAAQTASASAGSAAQNSAASSSILTDAKQAAAGAYASVSQIPVVGPFLAPAAAAAAFAAVMAYDIVSAEGGYDIPADVNPMAQLHAREMVLPARYADVIRTLGEDDRAGAGAGAGSPGDTHIHMHYAPQYSGKMGRADMEAMLREHSGLLARHLGNAIRNRAP